VFVYIAFLEWMGQFYCDIHTLELWPSMAGEEAGQHVV